MSRILKHFALFRCIACSTVAAINILHPLLHGTPLDSGAMDAMLMQLDVFAASLVNTEVE